MIEFVKSKFDRCIPDRTYTWHEIYLSGWKREDYSQLLDYVIDNFTYGEDWAYDKTILHMYIYDDETFSLLKLKFAE